LIRESVIWWCSFLRQTEGSIAWSSSFDKWAPAVMCFGYCCYEMNLAHQSYYSESNLRTDSRAVSSSIGSVLAYLHSMDSSPQIGLLLTHLNMYIKADPLRDYYSISKKWLSC
jgi:hypothetical protein